MPNKVTGRALTGFSFKYNRIRIPEGMNTPSSHPFLSGDLFASKCDLSVYEKDSANIQFSAKQVADAKVIFCPSDRIQQFFEEYSSSINASVLIFGNSDFDFNELPNNLPSSVKKIFAQNVNFDSEKMLPIPIGIENVKLKTNGKPSFFKEKNINTKKSKSILIGPFADTHVERHTLYECVKNSNIPELKVLTKRISPKKYARIAPKYEAVACPRGNGLDTHRFWETLYRNSHPVVRQSVWSSYWKKIGLPLIEIDDWQTSKLDQILKKNYSNFNRENIPALWWPYWEKQIKLYV